MTTELQAVDCSQIPNKKRCPLLTVAQVRSARGWFMERDIEAAIDSGIFLWVWDVSGGKREHREPRFWAREVIAPELCILIRAETVIESILGEREWWNVAALRELFNCSTPLIKELFESKALTRIRHDGLWCAHRQGLKKFLLDRLITP